MFAIFQFDFMIRALIAGIAVATIAPFVGTFLVVRRYSLLADTLAHVALVGIALGILLGVSPLMGALGVSVVAALGMERIRQNQNIFSESVLALFLSGSLAVALIILSLAHGLGTNLFSYLFGSITTVSTNDVVVVVAGAISVCVVMSFLYKQFFTVSYDEQWAKASGLPTSLLNTIFMIVAAITVALSIQVVGALLTGALIVIPVLTAMQQARSFFQTILIGIAFSVLSVIIGLIASFYLDVPSGATIVIVNLLFFSGSVLLKRK